MHSSNSPQLVQGVFLILLSFIFTFFFAIALDALYSEAYFYAFFGALCVKI